MPQDAVSRDDQHPLRSARQKADEFLRALVTGTISSTGVEFLRELVRQVSSALGIRYAFVGYLLPGDRIRTLAFWKGDGYLEPVEYSLEGTPCTNVIAGETCHYAQDVQKLFPRDQELVTLGVVSYLAVPLKDPQGKVLGHLAAMDVKPMLLTAEEIDVLRRWIANGARSRSIGRSSNGLSRNARRRCEPFLKERRLKWEMSSFAPS